MNWIFWGLTGLASLGVVGLTALAIFAPPMLAVVWKVASECFLWFFRTRIGFGVVVGIATFYGASWYQHSIDQEAYEREKAAFVAAQKQRDEDIKKDTDAFVRKQIADEFIAQQESNDEVADFKKGLNPALVCRVGSDADRLSAIGRGVKGGDKQGVRKAPKLHLPALNNAR